MDVLIVEREHENESVEEQKRRMANEEELQKALAFGGVIKAVTSINAKGTTVAILYVLGKR